MGFARQLVAGTAVVLLAVLVACGGGGGGSDAAATAAVSYPTLTTSSAFSLPALTEPAARSTAADKELGRVALQAGVFAPAGVLVELLDASDAASPVVLATARTDAAGNFTLTAGTAFQSLAARLRCLRATLADGTVLRAYAGGWTEISPASEAMLQEATRLYKAAAWGDRSLSVAELAAAQDTLGLLWRGRFGNLGSSAAVQGLVQNMRVRGPWNTVVEGWRAASAPALGDLAGLVRKSGADMDTDVTDTAGSTQQLGFSTSCFSSTGRLDCSLGHVSAYPLGEQFTLTDTAVTMYPSDSGAGDTLSRLLSELGKLPMIEFPAKVGTVELLNKPRYDVTAEAGLRAAVRVVRRTYDMEPVAALGTTVQALPVVLDYEVALLNTRTGVQTDYLLRQKRWFAPDIGRVRMETTNLVRTGDQVTRTTRSAVARAAAATPLAYADLPAAGKMDVVERGLSHFQAVFSAVTGKVYVGVADGGGRVLELDPATLATLRSLDTGALPRRLAVSADGSRLHVGLDGASIAEYRIADLGLVGTTPIPPDPGNRLLDRVYDLKVDPYDARRVLALAGNSNTFGDSGAVMMFRAGSTVMSGPAPAYDYFGWTGYGPYVVSWSGVKADEFVVTSLNSPHSMYRFALRNQLAVELKRIDRDDDIGIAEAFAEIVTDTGRILDAETFTVRRTISFSPLMLRQCQRLDQGSVLCQSGTSYSVSEPWLHLDAATGAFKGAYGRLSAPITNGCTGQVVDAGSGGTNRRITPTGDGRVLVSAIDGPLGAASCSLQLWRLHGAYP